MAATKGLNKLNGLKELTEKKAVGISSQPANKLGYCSIRWRASYIPKSKAQSPKPPGWGWNGEMFSLFGDKGSGVTWTDRAGDFSGVCNAPMEQIGKGHGAADPRLTGALAALAD